KALAFDRALIDPNETAYEGAPQRPGLLFRRFRVAQHQFKLRCDSPLHAAECSIFVEGQASVCAAAIVQLLQRVGQQWQGIRAADTLYDPFGKSWLQLESKPLGGHFDDFGE